MHEIMRTRIMRKLEALPPARLYQVLDYIDFLESRYAAGVAPEPAGLQRFAERLEDRMRARTVAPRVIGGAMTAIGAAGRLVEGVAGVGRGIAAEWESAAGVLEERRRSRFPQNTAGGAEAEEPLIDADAGASHQADRRTIPIE